EHRLAQSICRFEIDVEDGIPFFLLHAQEQIVARDAGVVDENRHVAETLPDNAKDRVDAGAIAYIEPQPIACVARLSKIRAAPRHRRSSLCQRLSRHLAQAASRWLRQYHGSPR